MRRCRRPMEVGQQLRVPAQHFGIAIDAGLPLRWELHGSPVGERGFGDWGFVIRAFAWLLEVRGLHTGPADTLGDDATLKGNARNVETCACIAKTADVQLLSLDLSA
ncbi:hypothetical protein XACJK48_680002 [Xanthomonas citri pv. citri]|nr:hypothetical protein XACJK48_680002 [Xanthomonas citri pv. citri]CEH84923.1 hypothetical protein XACS582_990002 [Xanthomonas citri pv. citri]